MHSYSIDQKRIDVLKSIGVTSFLVTLLILKLIYMIVNYINDSSHINYIPSIPQLAIFGFTYLAAFCTFDRKLWKTSIIGHRFSKIPNLNGNWEGKIKTSHDSEKEVNAKVSIKQTWSSILITLETTDSTSKSNIASISISESRLVYQYFNEPISSSPDTLHKHYGTAFLDIEKDDILKGWYFTDRDRQTHGDLNLKRTPL